VCRLDVLLHSGSLKGPGVAFGTGFGCIWEQDVLWKAPLETSQPNYPGLPQLTSHSDKPVTCWL